MTATSAQPRVPTEEIAGLVERVTFFNPESGFAVLRVQVRGEREPVTILGSLPSVSAGEWLTAEGGWVRDKEHGLQFKAKILKTVPPTTSEGVERYLASGFVKGIGPCSVRTVCQYSPITVGTVSNCVTMPLMPGSLTLTSAPTANRFLGDGLNCCFLTAMP
jgi:exodeoxyribonuclease V alpha subunit